MNDWTSKVPFQRSTYENNGWKDGRIGQAYDLISAVLTDRGERVHLHTLLCEIEALEDSVSACSVCGEQCAIYGHPDGSPNFCPKCCPDHEFSREAGQSLCRRCDEPAPSADWHEIEGGWND